MDEALAMESVQATIKQLIARFLQRNPEMDRDELYGEAQLIALKAVRSHDPKKSSLYARVYACVHHRLISKARNPAWRRRMSKKEGTTLYDIEKKESFDLKGLYLQVSDECKQAVQLAIDRGIKKTELSKTLYQELKWERSLIMQVFAEVRECL